MTAIVVTDTVLLVLLSLLVVGLLRSHAELLRRLGHDDDEHDAHDHGRGERAASPNLQLIDLPGPRDESPPAADIVGETPTGDAVKISVTGDRDTLVTFLSSGCLTCMDLWHGIRNQSEPLPGDARIVVVTKGRAMESPSRLMDLAPDGVPVVMSQEAWEGYAISMSPYFVHVDGRTGAVRSEGAASSWEQVRSLLRDAMADEAIARRRVSAGPG
jgi:hypothetical protein